MKTTPEAIIENWERLQPVFVTFTAWMGFLRIVARGDEGVCLWEIKKGSGRTVHRDTIKKWIAAGILESREFPTGGRPKKLLYATAKGRRLVGLSAESEGVPALRNRKQTDGNGTSLD